VLKRWSVYEIQRKIELYCAYQERCVSEVKIKLKQWNISGTQQDEIIQQLIENNFLDDQRFANSYVSGKFRIKRWGRIKIKHYLIQKQIPKQLIEKALQEINAHEYSQSLKILIEKKRESLTNETDSRIKKNKIINYLIAKGYEIDIILNELEQYKM